MSIPTFVVGTGRCGSTMLSNMVRDHPMVLSLSEFFGLVVDRARDPTPFSPEPVDGQRFWAIITAATPLINLALRHGVSCPELLYRCDAPSARFSRETGVPAILLTTLPHLTDEPDSLFEVLRDEVTEWSVAPIGEHYQHLFGWLMDHFGKRSWVERSGNMLMLEQLLATFPQSKFVHIVRDGRDAAISMSEQPFFRLAVLLNSVEDFLGVDPLISADRTHIERVPAEFAPFLPENFDPDALRAYRVPTRLCGEFWSQHIEKGLKVLRAFQSDRLLTLRYEDFFVDPKGQLDALAAFLGDEFVDEDWSARCAATVRKPRSTWRDLPEADAHALTEACRPGFELLREAGVHYDI